MRFTAKGAVLVAAVPVLAASAFILTGAANRNIAQSSIFAGITVLGAIAGGAIAKDYNMGVNAGKKYLQENGENEDIEPDEEDIADPEEYGDNSDTEQEGVLLADVDANILFDENFLQSTYKSAISSEQVNSRHFVFAEIEEDKRLPPRWVTFDYADYLHPDMLVDVPDSIALYYVPVGLLRETINNLYNHNYKTKDMQNLLTIDIGYQIESPRHTGHYGTLAKIGEEFVEEYGKNLSIILPVYDYAE